MVAGLAVSNIAWPGPEFPAAIALASELGLDGIELAPHNLFGRWDVDPRELRDLRARLEGQGLVCPAFQGILFSVPEAKLFESNQSRERLFDHLVKVARMAGLLGAKACVFGGPRQRDPGDLAPEQAAEMARTFFASVGAVFVNEGSSLAIEANARAYDCRFLTTTSEAIEFVRSVDTPGIGLQLDTGTVFLEKEDPSVVTAALALAVHAHVSEPQLQPVGSIGVDHAATAAAFKAAEYGGYLSIEMRLTEDWRGAVRHAVQLVRELYL